MPIIGDSSPSVTGREQIVLDPVEVADSRVEFEITGWVNEQGPDWGDAEIAAAVAEMQRGEAPVDFRIPNRKITIPLLLLDRTSATFTEVRRAIQQKVGLFQREGGWIKRDTPAGPLYADIVNASLKLGGSSMQAMHGIDADAVLTLECLPDWYGDEIELDEMTAVNGDIIGVLQQDGDDAVIDGDSPARCRIEVANSDATSRDLLLWAFRSRYYDDTPTAALAYEAEDLEPQGDATVVTEPGASGDEAVEFTATTLLDVVVGDVLSHLGSYRIWARAKSDTEGVSLGLNWWVNLAATTTNPRHEFATTDWEICDLGTLRSDRAPVGLHALSIVVWSYTSGSAEIHVDKLWLQPLDEAAGELHGRGGIAALNASRHAELRTDGIYHEPTTTGYYSVVADVFGDLPRLPPGGLEHRPVELFLTTGEPTADFTAQVYYRPSWLFAPGGS